MRNRNRQHAHQLRYDDKDRLLTATQYCYVGLYMRERSLRQFMMPAQVGNRRKTVSGEKWMQK